MANAGMGAGRCKISGAAFPPATGPRMMSKTVVKRWPVTTSPLIKGNVRLDNVIQAFCDKGPRRADHTVHCRGLCCLMAIDSCNELANAFVGVMTRIT